MLHLCWRFSYHLSSPPSASGGETVTICHVLKLTTSTKDSIYYFVSAMLEVSTSHENVLLIFLIHSSIDSLTNTSWQYVIQMCFCPVVLQFFLGLKMHVI